MNKSELVGAVAEEAGLTKVDAEKAVTGILEALTDCLAQGDKLTLVGFGTFSVAERAARSGQNPQTGKKIEIPASVTPKFKPGNTLKSLINQ
ncbi:HU family DNA-binding protein [Geomesophilobacter sediminis]|uniref:HU family DNA-binding protein n=1 Tax=Geomesophilobacter sediminis TaxID=2798584 RepID=A0A8J7LWW3_9BACT|nr:HU family DNA-binding protein [Geomesophilobacter sediminis]MBJ6726325.1 HU family DNA-binding protein [Geomesophilobacter sediminis]